MKTLRISHRQILILIVVGVFFLTMPSMGVSGVVAKENPKFVEVESPPPKYDDVSGMVKNGSEVSISVVLTNFSKEIEGNQSGLYFQSDLEDPVWGISIDGSPEEWKSPFTVDHIKVREARITLTGKAPEVNMRKEEVTLLNITQKIKDEYSVIVIKRNVTSELIEEAIIAMDKAEKAIETVNWTIINATEAGLDVSDAKTNLALANERLNKSYDLYTSGRPEEALEKAIQASASADDAKELAEGAKSTRKYYSILVVVVVIVIAIVVFVFLSKIRRKKRGIY